MAKKKASNARRKPREKTRAASAKKSAPLDSRLPEVILILCLEASATVETLAEKLQVDLAEAARLETLARERLAQAAGFDRAEELAKAKRRLEDIFEKSIFQKDRIAAQKELNKLLGLTQPQEPIGPRENAADSSEVLAIKLHLLPLGLAPENTPLPEIVRLAALQILNQG